MRKRDWTGYLAVGTLGIVLLACAGGAATPAAVQPTAEQTAAASDPAGAPPAAAPRADANLVPRQLIFGNPDHGGPRLSPDGKQLAWLAPKNGVMNVFVAPTTDPAQARPVTDEKQSPVPSFGWTYDSARLLYGMDKNGDENTHVFSVDVKTLETKDLTPFDKTQSRMDAMSKKFPTAIVIAMNDRDPKYHDLYRVDIVTGERKLLLKNERYVSFVYDDSLTVRYALEPRPDSGSELLVADGKGGFKPFQTIPAEDSLTTSPAGLDKAGRLLYLSESRNRDTSALVAFDTQTGKQQLLAEDARADLSDVTESPRDGRVQAAAFDYDRRTWKVLDPSVEADFAYLKTVVDGELSVLSRSEDDQLWTLRYVVSDGPARFYLYDHAKKSAQFLFSSRPALEGQALAKLQPVAIQSRDGKSLVSYLSLPPGTELDGNGKPKAALPLVLWVHGGPWDRDGYTFNTPHQWLATRGYAALSVNYRGSTGFGKAFINAGDKQWGAKMQDDLLDAVDWAVTSGIADRKRVAIMGGSYGGYATLVGLSFTPDVFACGIDLVGPSNLNTLLGSIPPYWVPMLEQFAKRVGDPRTAEGKQLLDERSPLTRASAIERPLLIAQGANDPRVKQAESDRIVSAVQAKGLPVSYLLFPDEGHGFARPENLIAFFAVSEVFLAQHLGGVYQPIGNDLTGSSIRVPQGAQHITGLAEALPR
jgi:dipeptidyl aminopeptidase/acylaminoacyl peptidase